MGIMEILAIIVVALVFVIKPVLAIYFPSASTKFKKYFPYAVMAFKYVEKNIDDNIGKDENDPIAARYAAKVDMFCKKFIEYTERFSGSKPNKTMIAEAMTLATHLARSDNK